MVWLGYETKTAEEWQLQGLHIPLKMIVTCGFHTFVSYIDNERSS